ncbi:MAG: MFS transporter [Cyanobacteriota bacterium]|nr:MFS transporter [Cyanobacteriota bacterium]
MQRRKTVVKQELVPQPETNPTPNRPEGSQPSSSPPFNPWWVLVATCVGTFMSTSSAGIVNTALPTMARVLQADLATAKWMVSGFLITVAGLLPTIGRLSDVYGPTRVYNLGFFIFVLGSALVGLSSTLSMAIGFRIVQAVGSTMLVANNIAILSAVFPKTSRGKAIGLLSTAAAVGTLCGPAIGGLILQAASWRWLFFVNLPLGLLGGSLAYIFMWRLSRQEVVQSDQRVDLGGSITFALTAFCLILSLSQAPEWGLDWRLLAVIGIGLSLGSWFVRRQQASLQPLLDVNLFRDPILSLAAFTGFMSFLVAYFTLLMVPYFLDQRLAMPPAQIGLLLTGYSLVLALFAPVGGWLADRYGTVRLARLGSLALAIGQLGLAILPTTPATWQVMLPLLLQGLGMGLFSAPNNTRLMNAMPSGKLGTGGSIVAFVRVFGQATGATLGVVLFQLGTASGNRLSPEVFMGGHRTVFLTGTVFSLLMAFCSR